MTRRMLNRLIAAHRSLIGAYERSLRECDDPDTEAWLTERLAAETQVIESLRTQRG